MSTALRAVARRFEAPDDLLDEPTTLFSDDAFRDALEESHLKRLTMALEARTLAEELEESLQFDPIEGYGDRIDALLEELQSCEDDEEQLLLSVLLHEPYR
jgi:hypothetical protein